MGHRALHAVARPGGGYDCYRSQWDGLSVFDDQRMVPYRVPRDATHLLDGATVSEVLRQIDPLADEALFVHEAEGRVTAYLVCRLGVPTADGIRGGTTSSEDSKDAPETALVPIADVAIAQRLDCALRTAKAVLGDAVDAGLLSGTGAERYLAAFLARHPDVPGETLWLSGEVI